MAHRSAVAAAQHRVVGEVLHLVTLQHDLDDSDAHFDAALQYAEEQLALAARDLAQAVAQLPASARPVGW